ncbi:MAG: DUF963 domain-containing protein [Lachnospiraceae bacterium]|nr:DUF963 domain-containing protein [Lachnospiraceae bacterium]
MKKTNLSAILITILTAAMLITGCNKSDNTGEKDNTDNPVVSETPVTSETPAVTATPIPSATPVSSVSPEPEGKEKYKITGADLDPEAVKAFREYICEHTAAMGRYILDEYYYFDVTGDGKPDLIQSVTHGSGIISTGLFVYDIENKQGYQLQDRGDYDYWVDSIEDGTVYIKKAYFGRMKRNAGAVGTLEFADGKLKYNGPEPDRSDLPTPVITKEPTVIDLVKVKTELYRFELPARWSTLSSKLSIEVDEYNNTVIRNAEQPEKVYLRVTAVTDIDSAWALLKVENMYSFCIFSKDHIFVWQTPDTPLDTNLGLGYYEFYDMANEMVVLKDGETNEAVNSISPEHIKKYIEIEDNEEILWPDKYSYGIKCIGGSVLSQLTLYNLYDTGSAPTDMLIIKDGDEICFAEHFGYEGAEDLTSVYSFDYDNNGVKEYGIISYDNHLGVAEKTKGALNYSIFDFDATPVSEYVKAHIALTVDPMDDHAAEFSLNGEEAIRVNCGYALDEKDYELEYLCILESREYGSYYTKDYDKSGFTAVFRANLPVKDGENAYDSDYAPLVFVKVGYKGNGVFEISGINIKNYGAGIKTLEFPEENFKDPDEGWDIYGKAIQDVQKRAVEQGGSPEDVREQNFRIMSIDEDGTVVLRAYYDYFDIETAGEPPSNNPEDYELEEGLVPLGTDITMKISDDCKFVYYPKNLGWNRYLITFSDLKYLVDNYYYMDYFFPLPSFDSKSVWYEYLNDFTCVYLNGVIYYMGEVYHA